MTAVQVDDFFDGYVKAFVAQDIDGICARWDYPALLVSEGRQVALDREAFRHNVARLCAVLLPDGEHSARRARGTPLSIRELLRNARADRATAVARPRRPTRPGPSSPPPGRGFVDASGKPL
jgi:hypothetical protein